MSDLIDRQAAINALSNMMDTDGFRDGWAVSRANVDCMLRSLPSAQPEKRTIKRTETHSCDCISREAAIDAVRHAWAKGLEPTQFLEELPSAQPAQHGRIFQEIVVEYPSISAYPEHEGKPYFSIKYMEDGHGFIGYGTYKPKVLSQYLKEYFMPSAQPDPDKLHLQREQAYMQGWEDARLIDRQAAIDALDCINGTEEVLRSLPSAQPYQAERMSELKPCPFCGGKAELIQKLHGSQNSPTRITNSYVVGCKKCDIFTKYYQSNIWQGEDGVVNIDANGAMDAIEAWNSRAERREE